MKADPHHPVTLLEAVAYFSDPAVAHQFVAELRWPAGPVCPKCNGKNVGFIATRTVYKCRDCKKQFSVKVGTLFEDSPIPLTKWMPAMWLIVNCKNGISSYELARDLAVTQKTAWFMLHRIRLAMQTETFGKMYGEVEADETYIGGLARNMHPAKRQRVIGGAGKGRGKVAVMGLLERTAGKKASTVRAMVVPNAKRATLQGHVKANVHTGSALYTDSLGSYHSLQTEYEHGVINHAERYVNGRVHTNGIENFWSLLKRSIRGTYVSIEPFHLFRYLDEQTYRFNNRKITDPERFVQAAANVIGRRLTYRGLIGKPGLAT